MSREPPWKTTQMNSLSLLRFWPRSLHISKVCTSTSHIFADVVLTTSQTSTTTSSSGITQNFYSQRRCRGSCSMLREFRLSLSEGLSRTQTFSSSFYGINLNQNVVLQQIGFDGSEGTPWNRLFRVSTGNMIITALGFVPGALARRLRPARKPC